MGMIRVSDEVEKRLKELSDGRSMSGTVEMLIKGCSAAADNMFALTKEFMAHVDEKFDELKELIEDTTVDRIVPRKKPVRIDMKWKDCQELFYEFMYDDEFASQKALEGVRAADDALSCYLQDGKVFVEGNYGDELIVNVTPRIELFLKEKGYEI